MFHRASLSSLCMLPRSKSISSFLQTAGEGEISYLHSLLSRLDCSNITGNSSAYQHDIVVLYRSISLSSPIQPGMPYRILLHILALPVVESDIRGPGIALMDLPVEL
jgi:hypothetical protein